MRQCRKACSRHSGAKDSCDKSAAILDNLQTAKNTDASYMVFLSVFTQKASLFLSVLSKFNSFFLSVFTKICIFAPIQP